MYFLRLRVALSVGVAVACDPFRAGACMYSHAGDTRSGPELSYASEARIMTVVGSGSSFAWDPLPTGLAVASGSLQPSETRPEPYASLADSLMHPMASSETARAFNYWIVPAVVSKKHARTGHTTGSASGLGRRPSKFAPFVLLSREEQKQKMPFGFKPFESLAMHCARPARPSIFR